MAAHVTRKLIFGGTIWYAIYAVHTGIQQESLQLLDWPAVCRQIACFSSTPMAADRLLQSGLPMGNTKVALCQL